MRKIIAILVVFALVVGAAFAETSISGTISVRAKLVDDTIDSDNYWGHSSGGVETGYIQLSGENDEGTFGGLFRFRANDGAGKFHRAYAYWRPIPQLEIFLGQDNDGKFSPYNAWTHFQGQEGYAHVHDWDAWRAAAGFTNWDSFGLAFTVKPIPGLELNLVVPFGGIGANANTGTGASIGSWEGTYAAQDLREQWGGGLQLTASFAIPDIGTVFFGLKGPDTTNPAANAGTHASIFFDDPDNFGTIGLAFSLSAVQGLDLLVGGSTVIPGEKDGYPLNLMLMANYSAGDFGVKTRWRAVLATGDNKGLEIGFDIQPYYSLGILTAYFNIGFVTTDPQVSGSDPVNQLVINPYIRVSLGAGSIRFGLLYADKNLDVDNDATISVPLVFGFSF